MRANFNKYGFVIFWTVTLVDLTLISLNNNSYRYFTKPLLVPLLACTVFSTIGFTSPIISKRIILIAFIAGTAGDFLLLKQDGFIAGLLCFLLVLLLYTIYFFRIQPLTLKNAISTAIVAAFISSFFALVIILLWENFGVLKLAIVVYSSFLLLMLVAAINTYYAKKIRLLSINFFIPGALLFVISDLTLAANKFYFQEAFLNIAIMACYCGGQYYLSRGFIKYLYSGKASEKASGTSVSNHRIHPN